MYQVPVGITVRLIYHVPVLDIADMYSNMAPISDVVYKLFIA